MQRLQMPDIGLLRRPMPGLRPAARQPPISQPPVSEAAAGTPASEAAAQTAYIDSTIIEFDDPAAAAAAAASISDDFRDWLRTLPSRP